MRRQYIKQTEIRSEALGATPPLPLYQDLFLVFHYHSYNSEKMGILMSRLFDALFGTKEVRILILGLDNAGKTTILYRLQNESDEAVQTIPTIGFNVETLQYKNIKVSRKRSPSLVRLVSRRLSCETFSLQKCRALLGQNDSGTHDNFLLLYPSLSTLVSSLGSWRTNVNSTILEVLLSQHGCHYFCCRFG